MVNGAFQRLAFDEHEQVFTGTPAQEAEVVWHMSQAACLPDLTQIMIKDTVKALATACNIQLIPGFEFSALKHILNECSNMGIPLFGSIRPIERPLTSVEITTALGDWCILVQQETKISAEPSHMSAASGTVVELTKSIREESSEKIAQSCVNSFG